MAHVGVEPCLSLDPLLQLVHHGVERVRQPDEIGIGGVGIEPGVELSARDSACRPGHVGQRSQGSHAGESAEGDAEHGRDHTGDQKRQPEHAEGVVEVREVEHIEVGGMHRGNRHAHHDLGTGAGANGLCGCCAAQDVLAQLQGDGRRIDRQGRVVVLGPLVQHRVRVGPGVDVSQQTGVLRGRGALHQRAAYQDRVVEGLVLGGRLAPGQEVVADGEVGQPAHQDGQQQRTETEDGRDPGSDAQFHVTAPACSPCP